jgi:hypothetical protein
VRVSITVVGSSSEAWLPNPVYSDGRGNFAITITIGREYAPYSEVRLTAFDAVSGARLSASYYVAHAVPSPPPVAPSLVATPTVAVVGQVVTILGNSWPAGAQVTVGIGQTTIEESLGVAWASAAGSFSFAVAGLMFVWQYLSARSYSWWAIILGFMLLALAALIRLQLLGLTGGNEAWLGALFLGALSLSFWVVYFTRRESGAQ